MHELDDAATITEPGALLGYRRDGRPIYLMAGGAPDDDENDDDDGNDDGADDQKSEDGDDDGADQLGDKGKKALDRMKEQRNTSRAALREYEALGLPADKLRELVDAHNKANEGEQPDPEKIREQARSEARTETLRERVLDKIEARARKFADPEDAAALLRGSVDDFIDGGRIDTEAIDEALSDLLEKKPHLAAQGRRFQGGADQGKRGRAEPGQLTRDDLKTMSAADIVKAQRDGRLKSLTNPNG